MSYTRFVAISVALCVPSFVGLQAQTLSQNPVPAEFPPNSYMGAQYVDSQGCVFIRAGIDGNVTWVPRVTRDRKQVCGATPSLTVAQTTAAAPAATPDVEQIVPRDVAAETPEPARASAVQSSPALQPPAPRAASVAAVPAPAVSAGAPAAANRDDRRILPSHLVKSRTELNRVIVPEGFELVWTDGRLNPKRGEQSVEGYKQSQRTLTLQVPRRSVGGGGPNRIKQPRIASDEPIRTTQVQYVFGSAEGR